MSASQQSVSQLPHPVIIKEQLTRKILRSVMSQFSSLTEAILELVDNAVDEFDGVHGGNHLEINIVVTKDQILVENIGGKGMGSAELSGWLSWGEPHKTDAVGEYGQGGKAAMGYLGSSWIVRAKRWDEPVIWQVKDDRWDDVTSEGKTFEAKPAKDNAHVGIGYCSFEIRNLKKHRQDIKRLKTELSNVYRTYLEEQKTSIMVNYDRVKPAKLPIYDGFKTETFRRKTAPGIIVSGWIGRLKRDSRVRGGPDIVGGMRLLRKGRLIRAGEYFGHRDFRYKASLGALIGEVEMGKVPVLPNKTTFDTDSPQWVETQTIMYSILKPHIDDLLSQKEEEIVTREEKKRVAQVREWMIQAFRLLNKYSDLQAKLAEDEGRKRPDNEAQQEASELSETREKPPKEREPRTPPPTDAVGKLRRLGKMPDWGVKPLEPYIRSVWSDKDGRRCLIINNKYWLYQQRKGDDLYIAETAALELARLPDDERPSVESYLSEVNKIILAFSEVYSTNAE